MVDGLTDTEKAAARSTLGPPPSMTTTLILGIVGLSVVAAMGMVAIIVFADAMSQRGYIVLFLSTMSATITPLVGLLVSRKVDAIHVQLNGRMTQLLHETKTSARLQGKEEASQELKGVPTSD